MGKISELAAFHFIAYAARLSPCLCRSLIAVLMPLAYRSLMARFELLPYNKDRSSLINYSEELLPKSPYLDS